MSWAGGQETGATPPEQTYDTVTLVLFQPFAFGDGDKTAEIVSGETTVKVAELLVPPPGTVTTTGIAPSVTVSGTVATMLVLLQEETAAAMPPKVTVPPPWEAPKFVPAIVTKVRIGPEDGVRLVMEGATAGARTSTRLR